MPTYSSCPIWRLVILAQDIGSVFRGISQSLRSQNSEGLTHGASETSKLVQEREGEAHHIKGDHIFKRDLASLVLLD